MNYTMTDPCDACPFLAGSGFTLTRLLAHASGAFACHKTCELRDHSDGEGDVFTPKKKSLHCAGALIFLEKRGQTTQMMRIAERLGMYDPSALNMRANVGVFAKDFARKAKA